MSWSRALSTHTLSMELKQFMLLLHFHATLSFFYAAKKKFTTNDTAVEKEDTGTAYRDRALLKYPL